MSRATEVTLRMGGEDSPSTPRPWGCASPKQHDEIAFLKYRLDVVTGWPDSEYRSALLRSILSQLGVS